MPTFFWQFVSTSIPGRKLQARRLRGEKIHVTDLNLLSPQVLLPRGARTTASLDVAELAVAFY